MKVMTVLGTRPEIIRLSRIIPLLDELCDHVLVHTGQNFEPALSDVFFAELGLRAPDHHLDCRAESAMALVGTILTRCERVLAEEKPDRLLVLGDTNSALAAVAAKRTGIPVFHMEAGNRCYDDRVPEEVNRRVVDHCSDVLMPYTERSRANLLREGVPGERIYVTGNPIREVLDHYAAAIAASRVLERFDVRPGGYFLATLHRAENVDEEERLGRLIDALRLTRDRYRLPLILSVHPRTRSRLEKAGLDPGEAGVLAVEPLGLPDFVHLEKNALCVLSDSGTVQEECCLLRVPCVVLRDVTERPETVEAGATVLAGGEPRAVADAVRTALSLPPAWRPPPEYLAPNVSHTVVKILLGYMKNP